MTIRQEIRDGCGRPIGTIETDERGNKRVCSYARGVVGYDCKATNRTVMVSGKTVVYCDCAVSLLF